MAVEALAEDARITVEVEAAEAEISTWGHTAQISGESYQKPADQ